MVQKKLVIKTKDGIVIDYRYGSEDALRAQAKRLREQYKRMGVDYKVSVVKA